MIHPVPHTRSNTRGKWLAGGLLALGLIAAIAGWKFRVMQPAQPPTSRVANP